MDIATSFPRCVLTNYRGEFAVILVFTHSHSVYLLYSYIDNAAFIYIHTSVVFRVAPRRHQGEIRFASLL